MTLTLRERIQLAELLDILQTNLTLEIFWITDQRDGKALRGYVRKVDKARRDRRKAAEWRDRLEAGR